MIQRLRVLLAVVGLAAAVALGGAASLSCNVNDYCVNCATRDGAAGDATDGNRDATFDGSSPGDACVPNGAEVCDGVDNDCDGKVDENTTAEPLPGVGVDCSSNVGECTAGKTQCTAGKITCSGKTPTPEVCDNKDNNCDGMVDNGDPGGGTSCGTDVGECVAGVNHCVNGAISCVGSIGTVNGQPEVCNGKDDDCDGMIDEDITSLGTCGTNVGTCVAGTISCVGGGMVCTGQVGPTFEICDGLDNDCNGIVDDGYNLATDPQNCGMCNHVCMVPHATAKCSAMTCQVGACDPGWYDINKDPTDGCEYQCNYQGPTESCNGQDDNCNGMIDEGVVAPANTCKTLGACAGATATCGGTAGWTCNYGPNVSTDAMGNIVPETTCDNIDNDCNGVVDDPFPTKGQTCHDTGLGICQGTGTNVCNATHDAVTCNITTPGQTATAETCNNLDDDCDGVVDNGANTGNLPGQNWITLASGHQIMQFEASRPDSAAGTQGTVATQPCSKSGVLPWTDVTAPQAQAACTSIGAHLCSEEEWQRACSHITPTVYPVSEPTTGTGDIFLEAEDFFANTAAASGGTTRSWEPDYTPGYSGAMALRAVPDTGADVTAANAPTQSPRLDYKVTFTKTGNHYVYVNMYGISPVVNGVTNAGNRVWVGISATQPGTASATTLTAAIGSWGWIRSAAINVPSTGTYYVSIYMRRDGVKVDSLIVSQSSTLTPTTTTAGGNTWAYDTTPNTYQANTCNGLDYDTDPLTAGNQDDIITCGKLASCDANWSGAGKIYDLSGNVKEWTLPRVPGVNPIRGGASNDIAGGLTCQLSFTAADDTFFFPNVGFRCCR